MNTDEYKELKYQETLRKIGKEGIKSQEVNQMSDEQEQTEEEQPETEE